MKDNHPTKICDIYQETKVRCSDCMDADTEIDFWHECYNGKHTSPEDCPTWYDWCNCGVTLYEEVEYLVNEKRRLKQELAKTKVDFLEQLRFMWDEYVLCNEDDLTADAKALRAELLASISFNQE